MTDLQSLAIQALARWGRAILAEDAAIRRLHEDPSDKDASNATDNPEWYAAHDEVYAIAKALASEGTPND